MPEDFACEDGRNLFWENVCSMGFCACEI